MTEPIRIDEVLAELERLSNEVKEGPAGFTLDELRGILGISISGVQYRLRDLVKRGSVRCVGKRQGVGISGVRCWTPVYQVVKEAKK